MSQYPPIFLSMNPSPEKTNKRISPGLSGEDCARYKRARESCTQPLRGNRKRVQDNNLFSEQAEKRVCHLDGTSSSREETALVPLRGKQVSPCPNYKIVSVSPIEYYGNTTIQRPLLTDGTVSNSMALVPHVAERTFPFFMPYKPPSTCTIRMIDSDEEEEETNVMEVEYTALHE